ncbi:succinate dehydrogenase, hydrophobic membrane anchor protein [Pseudoxanthomonas composti]|uniref:Succinate dehydrogenase hydrophobic membrane anchor subunit n=1 Tax=Pseudoxanthomonas composti TaxID=2137479 RepID=A0A4V1N1G9_9GAMM|nr:succinate dehydrogenase, hydrophobic membrane anchor protein [Pseudoxanthomonas composti]RXR08258.1 succinate dehydrogenase, hydrophobic membrane anchor protein [Pseudoxanthomonas composti]
MTRLRTPLKNASGLGSAKSGLDHWVIQRLTALGLCVLTIWFAVFVIGLAAASPGEVVQAVGAPVNTILLLLFLGLTYWHSMLGIQVILEDYVHMQWLSLLLQIANRAIFFACAAVSMVSVLRMAFSTS